MTNTTINIGNEDKFQIPMKQEIETNSKHNIAKKNSNKKMSRKT